MVYLRAPTVHDVMAEYFVVHLCPLIPASSHNIIAVGEAV